LTYSKLILLALLAITACNSTETTRVENVFSTRVYFTKEAIKLNAERKSLETMITHNGNQNKNITPKPDWEKVFEPFIATDISKTSLAVYYKKTTLVTGEDTVTSYQCLEDKQPVKNVIIKHNGSISEIKIKRATSSLLYDTFSELTYHPSSDFLITGSQTAMLLPSITYETNGRIINTK
jgi:hypothetical protein